MNKKEFDRLVKKNLGHRASSKARFDARNARSGITSPFVDPVFGRRPGGLAEAMKTVKRYEKMDKGTSIGSRGQRLQKMFGKAFR